MSALQRVERQLLTLPDISSWSDSEVVALFARVRAVLEAYDERKNYPTVALFCDWVLHDVIDRHREPVDRLVNWSAETATLLEQVDDFAARLEAFFQSGPQLLDLKGLTGQLATIAERIHAGSWNGVVNQAGINYLIGLTVAEITNRPAGFSDEMIRDPDAAGLPKWQRDAWTQLQSIQYSLNLPSTPRFVRMEVTNDSRYGNSPVVLISNRELLTGGTSGLSIALPVYPDVYRPPPQA